MKLKIRTTRIGSSHYDVKYVKDLKNDKGRRLFGRIWQDKKLIEIDEENSYETTLQALLHESIHGICWEHIIDDDDRELVEPITNGFYAFIMDNPEFIKLILKHAEKVNVKSIKATQ